MTLQNQLAEAKASAQSTNAQTATSDDPISDRIKAVEAQAAREQAVQAAVKPLQDEIATLKTSSELKLKELEERHTAELKALRDTTNQPMADASSMATPDVQKQVEELLEARVQELKAAHDQAVVEARENGRKESDSKMKMVQSQLAKLRAELTALKGGAPNAVVKPAAAANATASATRPPTVPALATTSAAVTGAPPAGTVPGSPAIKSPQTGLPAVRGRGFPARGAQVRGAAVAGRGRGRGSVLDSVNQSMASNNAPGSPATIPGGLTILGAGSKRPRDEEDPAPGGLAKRVKAGEASLPPKPGGVAPISLVRNRLAPPPPPSGA